MKKPKFETPDMTQENIKKIEALFPNCVTEAKDDNGKLKKVINFEMLKQVLTPEALEGDESYEFTWVGKKAAIVEANKPIRKTLRPCKEESVNWNTTENLYIEGDNLEVLKLLQGSYLGKVKMIYIDPPYNTGHDFVYPDSFIMYNEEYNEGTGYFDEDGNVKFSRVNTTSAGKYHSDWCSMMYSRLLLARNLLTDDGVIFISIDDNEIDNLRKICDEVFNSTNFICEFIWKSKLGKVGTTTTVAATHEYILCYSKNNEKIQFKMIKKDSEGRKENLRQWGVADRREDRPSMFYPIIINGIEVYPIKEDGTEGRWRVGKDSAEELLKEGKLELSEKNGKYNIYRTFSAGTSYSPYDTLLLDEIGTTAKGATLLNSLGLSKLFDFSKPVELINHFCTLVTQDSNLDECIGEPIIMDFFSGSATTAHAVMQLNAKDKGKRKFIMVQLPETTDEKSEAHKAGYINICEIGKERIRRAGKKIKEENPDTTKDLDIGFRVLKLDDSNMKEVYYSATEYNQNILDGLESNIKEDRSDLDLLFGCLLDWGIPLSLPYSSETIGKFTVHTYNKGDLVACFNEDVSEDVVKEIARNKPLRAVFRDSSFSNSASKINVFEIFKMISPETSVKVI